MDVRDIVLIAWSVTVVMMRRQSGKVCAPAASRLGSRCAIPNTAAGSADFAGWWSGLSLGSISFGGCEFAKKRGLTSTKHSCPSRAL